MTATSHKPLFPLGHSILATPGVTETLNPEEQLILLRRHHSGDWGNLDEHDRRENELALKEGFRLFSVYEVRGQKIWIITEADRSSTTILLPSEY